jgi:hypothetical protein
MHFQSQSTEHLQSILHPQPPSSSHPQTQSGGLQLQLHQVLQLQAILSAEQLQKIISMQEPQPAKTDPQEVTVPLRQNGRVCRKSDCPFCGADPCGSCGNCLHPERRSKHTRRLVLCKNIFFTGKLRGQNMPVFTMAPR